MRKEGCEDGQRRKLARRETGVKKVFSTKTTKHKSRFAIYFDKSHLSWDLSHTEDISSSSSLAHLWRGHVTFSRVYEN